MAGLWAELGIEPTCDAAAIRRAYAARLKTIRLDEEPQRFARLRQAYERALASTASSSVSSGAPQPKTPTPSPLSNGEPPLEPPAPALEPDAPSAPAPEAITGLLRQREVLAAAQWLVEARISMRLDLQDDMRLADQLGWTMAKDLTLPPGQVHEAACLLGWPTQANGAWAAALRARLDAETWLAGLRRADASWTRWLGASSAMAARMLLGRGRPRLLASMSRDPTLRKRYGEFLLHAPIVGDKFDPVRIAAVDAFMTRGLSWRTRLVSILVLLILAPMAVGGVMGDLDHRLQGPVTGLASVLALGLAYGFYLARKRNRERR